MRTRLLTFWLPLAAAFFLFTTPGLADGVGALQPPILGIEEQFTRLQHHGDPLAFRLGIGDDPYPWTYCFWPWCFQGCKHYQGLARMDFEGTPYFFLTRSGNQTGSCPGSSDNPGELLVVQMGSRGNNGERLRSNRLDPEFASFNLTPPPEEDIGVAHIHFSDPPGAPGWMHPGGVQIVDGVLVTVMQNYCPGGFWLDARGVGAYDCRSGTDASAAGLMFVDVSNPLAPQVLKDIDLKALYAGASGGYGSVAAIREPEGTYLFATTKGPDNPLDFWRSTTTDLRDENLSVEWAGFWDPYTFGPNPEEAGWWGWQMLNFVRDADGTLYLVGGDNTDTWEPVFIGEDWIRLFRVTQSEGQYALEYAGGDRSNSETRLLTEYPEMGNFKAAGGIYVSPTGQLIVYTGNHSRYTFFDGVMGLSMGEFRNIDVQVSTVDAGLPPQLEEADVDGDGTTETSCSGWVELYDEIWGWDANDSPLRSQMFDYRDRHLEDWNNLSHYDPTFNDKASALRWNLPPGQVANLFEAADYGMRIHQVGPGSGSQPDLRSLGWPQDSISSVWLSPVADAGGEYHGEVGAPIALNRANPCYVADEDDAVTFQWVVSGAAPCTISDTATIRPAVTCTEAGVYEILLTVLGWLPTMHFSAVEDSATLSVPEPTTALLHAAALATVASLAAARRRLSAGTL